MPRKISESKLDDAIVEATKVGPSMRAIRSTKLALVALFSSLLLLALSHPAAADPNTVITSNTTLTADVTGGIAVGADGITLDCAGHGITGVSTAPGTGVGILLDGRSGVTVENCNVTGFARGIQLLSSAANTLTGNTANNNAESGFALSSSNGNTLTGNTANNNQGGLGTGMFSGGFVLISSNGNTLTGNTAYNNGERGGFDLDSSSGNTLTGNTANNNLGLSGGFAVEFSADNNTLTGNKASNNGIGIIVRQSSNGNTLTGNTATNNRFAGIGLGAANGNTLTANTANNNGSQQRFRPPEGYGFWIVFSSNNILVGNAACGNRLFDAFADTFSTGNVFSGNSFCTTSGI